MNARLQRLLLVAPRAQTPPAPAVWTWQRKAAFAFLRAAALIAGWLAAFVLILAAIGAPPPGGGSL